MSSPSIRYPAAEGPGSVSQAPQPPAGFTDTFISRYVDAGEVRLHAVICGDGPPLLMVHGWPENWYAWRLLMPALARRQIARMDVGRVPDAFNGVENPPFGVITNESSLVYDVRNCGSRNSRQLRDLFYSNCAHSRRYPLYRSKG